MLTDKDFIFVGLDYVNPNLTYDPTYGSTSITFPLGGCKLSRLKNRWQRFLAFWWDDTPMMDLMEESYTNKVIKLTCPKAKLLEHDFKDLKGKLVEYLKKCKIPNIKDVIVYAI